MIANGWESPAKVTLRGYIKTLEGLAAFLGRNFEADSADFADVLLNQDIIDSLGFKPETFIGMFIPNTYEFYWTASPRSVVGRFHKEYEAFWNGERDRLAKDMGMSRNEVMTLASIVIGETNNTGEMPLIAGVYINRLKRGMRLQACPTVIYAHLKTEPGLRRILNRHLQIDSPYNTYRIKGLPPGPIAIPTVSAIDAVLHYTKSDYLYFCAKPSFDGTHNFCISAQNRHSTELIILPRHTASTRQTPEPTTRRSRSGKPPAKPPTRPETQDCAHSSPDRSSPARTKNLPPRPSYTRTDPP